MRTQEAELLLDNRVRDGRGASGGLIGMLVPVIALVIGFTTSLARGQGQIITNTLTHKNLTRAYVLYVPSSYSAGNITPLVVNVHGGGVSTASPGYNAGTQSRWSGVNAVAEREGFLVVYPEAIGGAWLSPDQSDPYDDIGFIDDVVAAVSSAYSVNPARIYATGFSAGSVIIHMLAAERPYTYAAVAGAAGVRPYVAGSTNAYAPAGVPDTPVRPFPLLYEHGTGDLRFPYNGGPVGNWVWPPCEEVVKRYVISNGCSITPAVTNLPNTDPTDSSTVELWTYTNALTYLDRAGNPRPAEVLFYRVVGGGHSWPADFVTSYPSYCYPVNHDMNLSTNIWNFFSRHEVAAAPAGRLVGFSFSPATGFRFTFCEGGMGARYRIQTSVSLLPDSWSDLTNFLYTGTITITDPSSIGTTRRFYRAVNP